MTTGHIQNERSKAQIYWIAKHGIKMTGMPAFGTTHSDSELWDLAVLVEQIPNMSPEAYRQQVRNMGSGKEPSHGHQGNSSAHDDVQQGHGD